ncbi:LEF-6 [Spodoptera eridania nucleopolyhedrovirus]|uniref:LEF-6 n=1 Tax=Spodoptera eridania nucleopolyhedrovirus TaxID=2315721 RepID=A0A346TQ64_9ABAC|nr:LEF-6 [Spodoptera eridania nucleopolyhedrovirus]AXU41724.1 LEF-6 [Spodoptera eridania nucleopolyhedrovirus]
MYVFYINGSNVEKRFGREFINFICGGKIKHDIKSDECTRKRVVVRSSYAAKKLLAANGRAFWPDGTKFRCKQLKPDNRRPRYDSGSNKYGSSSSKLLSSSYDCCDKGLSGGSVGVGGESNYRSQSPAVSEDWYNSASFIDINFEDNNHHHHHHDKSYYNNDTAL